MYDDLIKFHAEELFANEDFFGVVVSLAPQGNWNLARDTAVVSISDHLLGSNENRGDGVRLERDKGRSVRDSILVEFLKDANIQREQKRQKPDLIQYDGSVWTAVRTIAFDDAMKAVHFVRTRDVLSSGQTVRG